MILIIQNGNLDTYISKYLNEESTIVKSFAANVSLIDPKYYSLVIVLGGPQRINITNGLNKYNYLVNVVEFIKKCIDMDKPILGICLGFQLIAYALGYTVRYSGKLNIGYDVNILNFNNIFRCHYDYVDFGNDGVNYNIEYFESMPYFFRYKNVIGIQCHPDIPPEYINKYQNQNTILQYVEKNKQLIENTNKQLMSFLLYHLKKID